MTGLPPPETLLAACLRWAPPVAALATAAAALLCQGKLTDAGRMHAEILQSTRELTGEAEELNSRLERVGVACATLEVMSERAARTPGRADEQAPPAAPRNPLERKLEEMREGFGRFLDALDEWCSEAGVARRLFDAYSQEISKIRARLEKGALSAEGLDNLGNQMEMLYGNLLELVISKTDSEKDPARVNRPLQESLDRLVALAGMQLLDPREGEPLVPSMHSRLSTRARRRGEQPGTIAEVRTRGLRAAGGRIVRRAEVSEFD